MGVDLIGNRSDQELLSSYDSDYNKRFLCSPLEDIGAKFDDCLFDFQISDIVSEVKKSKSIISYVSYGTIYKNIQVSISTKYEIESLKEYLENRFRFRMLKEIINEDKNHAILLLAK